MDDGRNGYTKGPEEVKELVKTSLSSATTGSDKDKVTENGDAITTTTTTTEEASQKIRSVEQFFHDSNPTM